MSKELKERENLRRMKGDGVGAGGVLPQQSRCQRLRDVCNLKTTLADRDNAAHLKDETCTY